MFRNISKINTRIVAFILVVISLFSFVKVMAANDEKKIVCIVTSDKAFLYRDKDAETATTKFFNNGARFTAYPSGDNSWLIVYREDEAGNSVERFVSIFDLAVEFAGERDTIFDNDDEKTELMPPDYVESGGLGLDGVEGGFVVKRGNATLRKEPSLDAEILGRLREGESFRAVYIDNSDWIKTIVDIKSVPTTAYLYNGTIETTKTTREYAVIRIKSGVISVYSKPDIKSEKIGIVNAPVKFEGEWIKDKTWVKVEVANRGKTKYGYIKNK